MITLSNNQFTPSRLYLLKCDKLAIKNKQEDGLVFIFNSLKSKPLKVDEIHRFDCKVGTYYLSCEQLEIRAEVLVFNTYVERDRFQNQEEDRIKTKSEQQISSDEDSDEADEIMSAGMTNILTRQKRPICRWSTVETSSTYYSKKENYSATSDVCEQIVLEKRGQRKGSDPVIKVKELSQTQKPKITRDVRQVNKQIQIEYFARTNQKQMINFTSEQIDCMNKNWRTQKMVLEYLINQFELMDK